VEINASIIEVPDIQINWPVGLIFAPDDAGSTGR